EAEVTRILDESDAIPGRRRTSEGTKELEKPFELEVMDDPNIPAVEFVVSSPSRSGRKAKTDSKLKATPRTHDKAKTTLLRMNTRSQARNVET
ncbi:16443_t:CDS:2, partial [Acaulospora colombiana]